MLRIFDVVVSAAAVGAATSTNEDWCNHMAKKEYTHSGRNSP